HAGCQIGVAQVFKTPVLAELAEYVTALPKSTLIPEIQKQPSDAILPLSYAQQRLWLVDQLETNSAHYNMPFAYRLVGKLNVAALQAALIQIVEQHAILRTRIIKTAEGPVQQRFSSDNYFTEVIDLTQDPNVDLSLREILQRYANLPFNLNDDYLLRSCILHLADDVNVLVFTLHHIAADGWSVGLLQQQITELYEQYCQGNRVPVDNTLVQYADFAYWEQLYLTPERLQVQQQYWLEKLAGMPQVHSLPLDYARPEKQSFAGNSYQCRLAKASLQRLNALCQDQGASLYMGLQAALALLLSRVSQQSDIIIGTPVANREQPELEKVLGFFANSLVMRLHCDQALSFTQLLEQSKEVALEAYQHQQLPFEQLVAQLQQDRRAAYAPLFQIMLVLHNQQHGDWKLSGLQLSQQEQLLAHSKFDLMLSVVEQADGLEIIWEYNTDIFAESTIIAWADTFINVLEQVIDDRTLALSEVPLLNSKQRYQLIQLSQGKSTEVNLDIASLVENQAKKYPKYVALRMGDEQLSYLELDQWANRYAAWLQKQGAMKGDIVALCLDRGITQIVTVLAVLKLGAAYLPLDAELPAERLNYILHDAKPALLLIEQQFTHHINAIPSAHVLDDEVVQEQIANQPATPVQLKYAITSSDLAYILYTSGTTGQPKGVCQTQGTLLHLIQAQKEQGLDQPMQMLQFTPLTFDVSAQELVTAWATTSCLQLITTEQKSDLVKFSRLVEQFAIERLFCPPAVFSLLAEQVLSQRIQLTALKQVIVAGEALFINEAISNFMQQHVACELWNHYGPTETHVVTAERVVNLDAGQYAAIGLPVGESQCLILDQNQQLLPRGVIGELYVGGPGVARGYLNLPELSAECFVQIDHQSGRFYKTGDLVRWRGDNKLQYLGRSDDQVKIRGFRVELSEVTAALSQLSTIEQACVISLPDAAQHLQLVAYLVLTADSQWHADFVSKVKLQLKALLPAYMIPAVYMPISALPLTANGKVDKRALPSPDFNQHVTQGVAIEGDIEQQLQQLWAKLLKVEPMHISADSSFFALGGHSLLATRLLMLIQQEFGIELALRTVFEHDNIRELAIIIEQSESESYLPELAVCTKEHQLVELSFAQERLWFMQKMSPQASQYNMPLAMRIRGRLQFNALQQAFDILLQRHQSLRTRYIEQDGQVWQQLTYPESIPLVVRDFTQLPSDHAQSISQAIDELASKPFALDSDLLLRAELLRLEQDDNVLLLCMHHIATDGASLGVFLQDLQELYQAACQQQTIELAPYKIQYRDFAKWQRHCAAVQLEASQDYWRQQLQGIPAVHSLPLDRPRSVASNYLGGVWSQTISATKLSEFKQLARKYHVSDFMLLHAVFSVLLARLSNENDIVIGTPLAQRNQPELSRLMGVFLNTLVLRVDLATNPTLPELLQQIKQVQLDAHQHAAMPFEKLVELLNPQRSLTHTPLFQIMLNYNNNEQQPFSLYQTEVEMLSLGEVQNKYDLTLYADDSTGELILNWVYDANVFDASSIVLAATQFEYLLSQFTLTSNTPVLSHNWGEQWPETRLEHKLSVQSIPELFSLIAKQNANRIALQCQEQKVSYAELDHLSNQWAEYFKQHFLLETGARVAIALPRNLQRIVAMLAVVKCGATYVPLSTELPAARVNYMAQAAEVNLVLSSVELAKGYQWPKQVPVLITDHTDFSQTVTQCSAQQPDYTNITAQTAAHIIFTSGSTGQPKGVVGTHEATLNRVLWMKDQYPFDEGEQCCHITSMAFTRAVWELWLPLLCGQTLHLIDRAEVKEPSLLFARLQQRKISRLVTAPSLLRSLLEYQQRKGMKLNALRYWFVSGEPLPVSLANQALAQLAPTQLINLYGSTEVMSDISYYNVSLQGTGNSMYVPVGQAISNSQLLLLDKQQQPVSQGAIAEIVVTGSNLALGYLGQEDQTAEKFIQTPIGRAYRTGDLGRLDWQGQIHCLGRMDDQVKIRGYRLELGEIEAKLLQHEAISNALVKVVGSAEDKQLIAYLQTNTTEQMQLVDRIRVQLAQELPDYMQPVYYHCMEKFALRPNGKVDRHQLPEVNWQQSHAYQAPQGETEQRLAMIWANLLRIDQVGRDDNFFRIGGHSLLATRLVNAIFAEFATELTVKIIFEANTVAKLAVSINQAQPCAAQPKLRSLQHANNKAVLSYAQQRMWFMHQLDEGSGNYNIPMSYRLRGKLDYSCLQQVFDTIFKRHATLRTRFVEQDGVPLQWVQPEADFVLSITDLSNLPAAQQIQQQHQLALIEANTSFNLQQDLMLRVKLLKMSDSEHMLLMTVHHIVADGWSMGILAEEFVRLYDAFSQGKASPLPALPVQYIDFAVWQREWLAGEMLHKQVSFWRDALAGAPAVHNLPLDKPRPASQTFNGAWLDSDIDLTTVEQLKQLAQKHDVTLFMLLQTAFAVLVSRLSNETDIVMGSPVANRRRDELNHLVGFFVNTLILRNDFASDPTFNQALGQARQTHLDAQSNQDIPFELLVEELNPQRSLSYSPLFQLMFVLHNNQQVDVEPEQLDIEAQRSRAALAKFDLTLIATETDIGLQFNWEYNTDLFSEHSIIRFNRYFMQLLQSILHSPETRVSRLALTKDVAVKQKSSQLPVGYTNIGQLIAKQSAVTPDATALIDKNKQYSYQELDQLTNQLARWLRQQGIESAEHVGVMLPRSADVVLVFVALLKLGAVYTPLDTKAPPERLQQIINNAGITRVLTTLDLQQAKLSQVRQLILSHNELTSIESSAINDVCYNIDDSAYLIHTSGSTGTPKGVLVPHRTILALLAHQQQGAARLEAPLPTLMFASLQFDVSIQEMATALTTGSALVVADEDTRLDMPALISLMQQQRIGRVFMPYAVLQVMAHAVIGSSSKLSELQVLVTAGEQLRITPEIRQFFQQHPQAWLVNHYGPSETHVTTEYVLKSPAESWPMLPAIGSAISGTISCVLDKNLQVVPEGAVGELYLGGDCLAKGYVGAPELTAERFVQLELNGASSRWYRSGDLVRFNHQGHYDYQGRADQQLKIRGFRVEPGEIEHCILSFPNISDVTVVLQDTEQGAQLAAYFVSSSEESVELEKLQQYLKRRLPDYMWPKGWMQLSAIPLTRNGKVNKRELPLIELQTETEGEQATTETEIELAQLWLNLLPGTAVLRQSDFFALGGHSLLAMRLVT
ncbi:amino acid adenylation domain-containing protein, partial [Rheinheimera sp. WS51]|uniref:non-ribosomal peptide synthetase n=1 Tax=Rheinheimera sp. WS51 TaxID=3425886 RepID=UPI003D8FCB27